MGVPDVVIAPHFQDSVGNLMAILIPHNLRVDGIEFLTPPSNNFQIGLMQRNTDSPVPRHTHQAIERQIKGTQEFLLIREGRASVYLYEDPLNTLESRLSHQIELSSGDGILLISGAHSIEFSERCELLEIKQGPYLQDLDKIIHN